MPTWTTPERIIAFLAFVGFWSIVIMLCYAAGKAVDYIKEAAKRSAKRKAANRKTIHALSISRRKRVVK